MLRFFEAPETASFYPADTPPAQLHHNSRASPEKSSVATSRYPFSLLATVNLATGRWHPSPFSTVGNVNHSFNTVFCGGGMASWQDSGGFRHQSTDSFLASSRGGRTSLMAADIGRRNQQAKVDWRKRGNMLEEEIKNLEFHKRQKTRTEEKLHHLQPSVLHKPTSTKIMGSTAIQKNKLIQAPVKKNHKLGDKITTLQQLVSPFGKTDTASVLQEATICIQALHQQINMLIRPHFGSSSSSGGIQVNEGGGRSRLYDAGLCIVPFSKVLFSFAEHECLIPS